MGESDGKGALRGFCPAGYVLLYDLGYFHFVKNQYNMRLCVLSAIIIIFSTYM